MAARPKTMPEPSPMLCTLVDEAFDSPDWTFEPKFDGLRVLARFDGDELTLLSRNNKPQEARFPEIAEGVAGRARPPGDRRRRGRLPRRDRQDELPRAPAAVPPRRPGRDPPADGEAPGLHLPLRHPLPRRLRRDPPAARRERRSCSARRSPGPTGSAGPTPSPARGSRAGNGPARRARRGSSASGSTASTSRAAATPG